MLLRLNTPVTQHRLPLHVSCGFFSGKAWCRKAWIDCLSQCQRFKEHISGEICRKQQGLYPVNRDISTKSSSSDRWMRLTNLRFVLYDCNSRLTTPPSVRHLYPGKGFDVDLVNANPASPLFANWPPCEVMPGYLESLRGAGAPIPQFSATLEALFPAVFASHMFSLTAASVTAAHACTDR